MIYPTEIKLKLNFLCNFKDYKGNKGRCKESTIRGHRKNLSPRWDSNPRPSVFLRNRILLLYNSI